MLATRDRRLRYRWPIAIATIASVSIACDQRTVSPPEGRPEFARGPEWIEVRDPQAPVEGLEVVDGDFDYPEGYRFHEDWFTHNIPHWAALLQPYMGRPNVQYLEVGLWEGRSFLWMLDHVLTHPSARATGIDIEILDDLLYNIELSGAADRVATIEGSSRVELRRLPPATYDIVYIDGSHTAEDVIEDMVLSWRLLKPGGLMILDDYRWNGSRDPSGAPLPDELLPRIAIDAFVSTHRNFVEVVLKGYQVALRKRAVGCPRGKSQCSSLGTYSYDWRERLLYRGGQEVALSESERDIVEALIRSKRGDALTLDLDPELHRSQELRALDSRLGLGLW